MTNRYGGVLAATVPTARSHKRSVFLRKMPTFHLKSCPPLRHAGKRRTNCASGWNIRVCAKRRRLCAQEKMFAKSIAKADETPGARRRGSEGEGQRERSAATLGPRSPILFRKGDDNRLGLAIGKNRRRMLFDL